MSMEIRFPNITAKSPERQLEQIRSYLHQTVEQLNWALRTVESGGAGASGTAAKTNTAGSGTQSKNDAASNFSQIKSLIIKSADIVNAYYEKISARLEGEYVSQSDFGNYTEQTSQEIEANSTSIERIFTSLQEISDTVDGLYDSSIVTNAYLKSGLLHYADDGTPVYGLEIGQTNTVDGVDTFDKFARFTSDRLSFYDSNDVEVAYISDYKLYITNAEIIGSLTVGKYKLITTNGLAFKWVGGA